MNIDNYRALELKDYDDNSYGLIMLNNKHNVNDFQKAINDIKNRYFDNGNLEWQVSDILEDESLNKFDWFELPSECDDYIEI